MPQVTSSTPASSQHAVVVHSVPVHGRTVLHDSSHPLAALAARVGPRDPVTGCLDRTSVVRLAGMLGRDAAASVGVIVIRLEGEGAAGDDVGAPEDLLRDALRVQTARFLMRHVRDCEPLVQSDDDEFLVLIPGAEARDTERVARRVQLSAFNKAPAALSIGWESRTPGEPLEVLVGRARAGQVEVPQGGWGEERRRYRS